jgi:hypothetical protein
VGFGVHGKNYLLPNKSCRLSAILAKLNGEKLEGNPSFIYKNTAAK